MEAATDRRRRYTAFLSYSHADAKFGGWLHGHLEGYKVPRALRGRASPIGPIGKRLGKIFRDRADLSAAFDLGALLRARLDDAGALIVLCSPRSSRSPYVAEEIRYFKNVGKGQRIFAAIVDGEPHASVKPGHRADDECFPRALLHRIGADGAISDIPEPAEPIAADFRSDKDGRANGALKIIAGLLGIDLDELVQREKAAERWRRIVAFAIAAAMTLLAAIAVFAGVRAVLAETRATHERDRALQALGKGCCDPRRVR